MKTGLIIVNFPKPSEVEKINFASLVQRVSERLDAAGRVLYVNIENLDDQLKELVEQLKAGGVDRIVLIPAARHSWDSQMVDYAGALYQCRKAYSEVKFELLVPNLNDQTFEDDLVERSWGLLLDEREQFETEAAELEYTKSIIAKRLSMHGCMSADNKVIITHVIAASADYSFGNSMRIHSLAIDNGTAALKNKAPLFCDSKMVACGLEHYDGEVITFTNNEGGLKSLGDNLDGSVVIIGEKSSSLTELMDILKEPDGPVPAVVIAMPVGIVGAFEAKVSLTNTNLCYITNINPRGGMQVTLAAFNGLLELAKTSE